jgi:hypothetical protein
MCTNQIYSTGKAANVKTVPSALLMNGAAPYPAITLGKLTLKECKRDTAPAVSSLSSRLKMSTACTQL